jgi:hypothetical protein
VFGEWLEATDVSIVDLFENVESTPASVRGVSGKEWLF